jgi:predicted RNase H-like nuclease (RuvC/YqgF family)
MDNLTYAILSQDMIVNKRDDLRKAYDKLKSDHNQVSDLYEKAKKADKTNHKCYLKRMDDAKQKCEREKKGLEEVFKRTRDNLNADIIGRKERINELENELNRELAKRDHWRNRSNARDQNIQNLAEQIRLLGLQNQVGHLRYNRLMRQVHALRIQMQWFRFRYMIFPINIPYKFTRTSTRNNMAVITIGLPIFKVAKMMIFLILLIYIEGILIA